MASLFWVGGSTAYDGTTNRFATSSGGSATVALVTSSDDVTFDANSPAAAAVTTSAAISCNTLTLATGFTGSLTMSNSLTAVGAITLNQGTLNTNGQTVSALQLSSATANTRTITLGASPVTLTGSAASVVVWDTSGGVSPTMTANTAVVTFNGAGGTAHNTFNSNGFNLNGMSAVFSGSGNILYNHSGTIANITRTGTAAKTDTLQFNSAVTITGTLTVNGNSTTNRMLVQSTALGTARTLTVNTTVTSTNTDWQDITAAGTASWNLASATGGSGDALGNTGITFTTAAPQFWTSGTGNWSDSTKWFLATNGTGGAGRVPLPQDNVTFDASSFTAGSQTISLDMPRAGANISFSGVTNTPAWAITALTVNNSMYGNLTGGTATQGGWANTLILQGRGAQTITQNGFNHWGNIRIDCVSGTYTQQDAFIGTGSVGLIHVSGTYNANNQTVTVTGVQSSGTTRTLTMGTGAWSLTSTTAGAIWNTASSGLTLNVNTAIVSATGAPGGAITVTVTTGGVTMPNFTVNGGANLTVQFSDAFTTAGTVTLTQGTLDTNGKTCSWAGFNSANSNTRVLTLGASAITITGSSTGVWDCTTSTNLTLNAGTSTITFNSNGGTTIRFSASANGAYNNVVITNSSSLSIAGNSSTFANLTIQNGATKTMVASVFNTTTTVTGTLTITGNSVINRVFMNSSTIGSARTFNAAALSLTNVDWQDITASGVAAPFTGTSMGNALGNSNITFDSPVAQTRSGAGGNWSTSGNWTSRVPLPQDNVIINGSSSGTISADMPRLGADQTYTGFAGTITPTGTITFFGSITNGSGMTYGGAQLFQASGRSSHTITSSGVGSFAGGNLTITGPGGTYTLQDALTITPNLNVDDGTFVSNNFNISCQSFLSASNRTRAVTLGTSTITLTRTSSGNIVNITSGVLPTLSVASATFVIGNATANVRTFNPGVGQTYGTITYTVAGSTGQLIMGDNFTASTINVGDGRGFSLKNGVTTTVTTFNVNGTLGSPTYVTSFSSGSAATLALPNGVTTCNYIIFKDITVTGGTIKDVNGQLVSGTTGITLAYARTAVPSTTPRQPANGLFLPGIAGNYVSVPDSSGISVTGDIDLRALIALNKWKPAVNNFVLSKNPPGNRSYSMYVASDQTFRADFSLDGTNLTSAVSSIVIPAQNEQMLWIRATRVASTGTVQFFTASGGILNPVASDFVQLGTNQATSSGNIADSSAQLDIGAHVSGTSSPMAGKFYKAQIRNGIDGSLVLDINFTGAVTSGQTDPYNNTWTVNSSGIPSAQLVSRS